MSSWSRHLIEAPTAQVVTLDEAKKSLRLTDNDQDDLVRALIASATAEIDPAGGGWLGRALRPQTWEIRNSGYPCYYSAYYNQVYGGIQLPYPPLISVDSVTYDDSDGVEQTLEEDTGFRVMGGGNSPSYLVPVYNGTWPSSVRSDPESVRIRFTSGYPTTPPDTLPAPIKQAVLLAIRDLWSLGERNLYLRSESAPGMMSYEWTVSETAGTVIRGAAENLLKTYRVYE